MTLEDVIRNFKYAMSGECTENLGDFQDEFEIAIDELRRMQELRRYVSLYYKDRDMIDGKFYHDVKDILENPNYEF